MSGSVAAGKNQKEIGKFTLNGDRPFDSYLAKKENERALKNNPGFQAEMQGGSTTTSSNQLKPKRKKSKVGCIVCKVYLL